MKDVLVVDDEREIALSIKEYFENFGVSTDAFFDASFISKNAKYKVILLDINLGEKSGYDLVKMIKENNICEHIIFITARNREQDIIKGYMVGGDDYIVKPFQLNILLLKVKNIIKKGQIKLHKKYREYEIDEDGMRLFSCDKEVLFKNQEFRLFMYLYENRGKVLSKYDIIKNVWGEGYYTDNNLNVHIKRLREKLGDNGQDMIVTYWGVGYKLL